MCLKVTCLTPEISRAEGVLPLGGSGCQKYICNHIWNVWKNQGSKQGPTLPSANKSDLSLPPSSFCSCKDPKHFLVQNENAQCHSLRWCLFSRLSAFQHLDQYSKIKITQLDEDLLFLDSGWFMGAATSWPQCALKKVSLGQKPEVIHGKTKQKKIDSVCFCALSLGLRCPVLSDAPHGASMYCSDGRR